MTGAERKLCIKALQSFASARAPEKWTTGMAMLPEDEKLALWEDGERAEWLAVKLGGPMAVHPGRNAAKTALLGREPT